MPKTLIHNDFNPRNIAFRRSSQEPVLCAYDWELATLHLPQHDLAELLVFTLTDKASQEEVKEYADYHRQMLEQASGTRIGKEQWLEGYELCLLELMVNRIAMYLMAHSFRHYKFMERVVKTAIHLLSLCQESKFSAN
jgi:aminoglycoside phosphotransferase (APT) family kinase protein